MAKRTHEAHLLLFDERIGILDRKIAEASPVKHIFSTVGIILNLVRDKMIANKDSVQLSDYCFNLCEELETKIRRENTEEQNAFVGRAIDELGRIIYKVERTLRRGANVPRMEYDKSKIEKYKLEIQQILNTLDTPSSLLDGNSGIDKRAPRSLSVDPYNSTAMISASKCALERLIRNEFSPHELPSLIVAIFAWEGVGDTIRSLRKESAQVFVDIIHEALDRRDFSPLVREKCLRRLYRTCGCYAILPTALKISVRCDRSDNALYRGGYADVWKGEYHGRDVAVKVVRAYSNSDSQKLFRRFCKEAVMWGILRHPNILPFEGIAIFGAQFAIISGWMANGNINEFVKENPGANRLKLMEDVAKGLMYIHSNEMTHGDLKGANVLVDQTHHARVADFGFLTIISNSTSSSQARCGTARFMSPELIAPQEFGLNTSRPTKSSDCYSLGMVIYETISGRRPFHKDRDLGVFVRVLKGERPRRRLGFTNGLWKTLERCWTPQPDDRPSIEGVLQCLQTCSPRKEDLSFDGTTTLDEQEDHYSSEPGTPSDSQSSLFSLSTRESPPLTPSVDPSCCAVGGASPRAVSEAHDSRGTPPAIHLVNRPRKVRSPPTWNTEAPPQNIPPGSQTSSAFEDFQSNTLNDHLFPQWLPTPGESGPSARSPMRNIISFSSPSSSWSTPSDSETPPLVTSFLRGITPSPQSGLIAYTGMNNASVVKNRSLSPNDISWGQHRGSLSGSSDCSFSRITLPSASGDSSASPYSSSSVSSYLAIGIGELSQQRDPGTHPPNTILPSNMFAHDTNLSLLSPWLENRPSLLWMPSKGERSQAQSSSVPLTEKDEPCETST